MICFFTLNEPGVSGNELGLKNLESSLDDISAGPDDDDSDTSILI
jgi:hypothetical protein